MRYPIARRLLTTLVVGSLLGSSFMLAGCATGNGAAVDTATRSQELTPGEFPETMPTDPVEPPPPMLRDPKSSVYSYLLWISYAYRILNSDVATMAFSPYEEVRVNSYVEYNRQNSRAIDQKLVEFVPGKVRTKGATATVPVVETWRYRYIKTSDGSYDGPANTATYDATYTVVNTPGKGWLVDKVEATARGGQPK